MSFEPTKATKTTKKTTSQNKYQQHQSSTIKKE